jgi:hypothetical protein
VLILVRPNEGESTLAKDAVIRYYLHGDAGKGGGRILPPRLGLLSRQLCLRGQRLRWASRSMASLAASWSTCPPISYDLPRLPLAGRKLHRTMRAAGPRPAVQLGACTLQAYTYTGACDTARLSERILKRMLTQREAARSLARGTLSRSGTYRPPVLVGPRRSSASTSNARAHTPLNCSTSMTSAPSQARRLARRWARQSVAPSARLGAFVFARTMRAGGSQARLDAMPSAVAVGNVGYLHAFIWRALLW